MEGDALVGALSGEALIRIDIDGDKARRPITGRWENASARSTRGQTAASICSKTKGRLMRLDQDDGCRGYRRKSRVSGQPAQRGTKGGGDIVISYHADRKAAEVVARVRDEGRHRIAVNVTSAEAVSSPC